MTAVIVHNVAQMNDCRKMERRYDVNGDQLFVAVVAIVLSVMMVTLNKLRPSFISARFINDEKCDKLGQKNQIGVRSKQVGNMPA